MQMSEAEPGLCELVGKERTAAYEAVSAKIHFTAAKGVPAIHRNREGGRRYGEDGENRIFVIIGPLRPEKAAFGFPTHADTASG